MNKKNLIYYYNDLRLNDFIEKEEMFKNFE